MKEKNSSIPINQEEIQVYLKDIRKIKVMTPDREKELAKMISTEGITQREKTLLKKNLLRVIYVL